MPEPRDHNSRGWTFDSFEHHVTERFVNAEKAVATALIASKELFAQAMSAAEKAVTKAEAASEKRQDASNEIRQAMVDQQQHFADKTSTDFRLAALEKKLDEATGRARGFGASGSLVAQIVVIVIAIAAIGASFLRH